MAKSQYTNLTGDTMHSNVVRTFGDASSEELEKIVTDDIRNGDNPGGASTALAILKQRRATEALLRLGRIAAEEQAR